MIEHFVGYGNTAPRLLDLVELECVDETENDHTVNDDDPPEDVDADAPPRVKQLKHEHFVL